MRLKKKTTDDYLKYSFKDDHCTIENDKEMLEVIFDAFKYAGSKFELATLCCAVVYTFYDKDAHPIYVGKSMDFASRLYMHEKSKFWNEIECIGFITCTFLQDMDLIEIEEIQRKMPKYNGDCNRDSSWYHFLPMPVKGANARLELSGDYHEYICTKSELLEALYEETQ